MFEISNHKKPKDLIVEIKISKTQLKSPESPLTKFNFFAIIVDC
jgi:hypothetical protein